MHINCAAKLVKKNDICKKNLHICKKSSTFAADKRTKMRKRFTQILVWLGIMAALTLIAMGAWVLCGGSQTTAGLKWLQFVQTLATFLLPPILCAWMWDENHRPFSWLQLDRKTDSKLFLLAVGIMVCAIPAINLLADLNGRIRLPESLSALEQKMRVMEDAAAALTEQFLHADNIGMLLVNLGLMALLPAFAEELSFRGTLQQILGNKHVAIWVTAVIFSAIHMQFFGFVPRMLMGAMFGYIFVWTGSLWVPIVMHFTNNGLAVLAYYIFDQLGENSKNYADTFGAGTTWWVGVWSLVLTCLGLREFYRRTHKQ